MIDVKGKIFAQYFICCSKCEIEISLFEHTQAKAKKAAEKAGWSRIPITKQWVCLECKN